jgi:hypothetical protein
MAADKPTPMDAEKFTSWHLRYRLTRRNDIRHSSSAAIGVPLSAAIGAFKAFH